MINSKQIKKKRRILVADDQEINRDVLGAMLEDYYDIIYASDGLEALEMITENINDLSIVLLDIFMPNMNGLEVLIPNITSVKTLSTESYFILAAWGILGFVVFNRILRHDKKRHFGRSTVAWIVLLGLIIFCSSIWMRQSVSLAIDDSVVQISNGYIKEIETGGADKDSETVKELSNDRNVSLGKVENRIVLATVIQVALIAAALFILFVIYSKIQKREKQIEIEKAIA